MNVQATSRGLAGIDKTFPCLFSLWPLLPMAKAKVVFAAFCKSVAHTHKWDSNIIGALPHQRKTPYCSFLSCQSSWLSCSFVSPNLLKSMQPLPQHYTMAIVDSSMLQASTSPPTWTLHECNMHGLLCNCVVGSSHMVHVQIACNLLQGHCIPQAERAVWVHAFNAICICKLWSMIHMLDVFQHIVQHEQQPFGFDYPHHWQEMGTKVLVLGLIRGLFSKQPLIRPDVTTSWHQSFGSRSL